MNKARRTRIAQAVALINDVRSILEEVRDEEGEAFENMPDSLKESDRGREMEEGLDRLSEVCDDLENIDLSDFEK